MPRVLYISQDGNAPSGISTYGFQILGALPEVRLLLLNAATAPKVEIAVADRIALVRETESHNVETVAQRIQSLIETAADQWVILPNTGDTPWSATVHCFRRLAPAVRSRVRVLGIVHSDVETQYSGAVRYARFASAWMAVSRHCANTLQGRLASHGVREVTCLPYPMVASESWKVRAGGPLRLVYSGRLEEPQKCVSRLATVFSLLAVRGVDFSATIAGDGPATAELAEAIASGPAADRVKLVGTLNRSALQSLLEASDVFLLTSAYEGLPLAMLEAMAAGVCPVVMEIQSGLGDALTSETDGMVVPQGDTSAMAKAIVELARDRRRLESLQRAAHARILREFSPGRHFDKLRSILDECFQRPAPDPDLVPADPTASAVARLLAQARRVRGAVAVYGAGMFGRKVVDACLDAGVAIAAWFDSDPAKAGLAYRGLVCRTPGEIVRFADTTFLIGSLEFTGEIAARIKSVADASGLPSPQIVTAVGRSA